MSAMEEDEEEEVVMMDLEEPEEKPKAVRRVPRRTRSTDGSATSPRPARRSPVRTRSTDGGIVGSSATKRGFMEEESGRGKRRVGRLAATSDDTEDTEDDNTHNLSPTKPARRVSRRVPGRSKTSDGLSRMLPMRTKSGQGFASASTTRSTPKRTASGFGGRTLPRRAKSSDGTANSFASMRRGGKKKAGATADHMNIFGSDLMSTSAVIDDIGKAQDNPGICRLELEDFFMAERSGKDPEVIAEALKTLLECDDRPWESVQFVDNVMDGSIYYDFRDRKKHFMRCLGGVCEARLIPVSYKAKVTLSSDSLDMEAMAELLFYLQGDKSVTDLTLKSDKVDESIVRGLTALFGADKRKWESVTLQLSGAGPGKPGSPEHNEWAKAMQAATEAMQKVCKERGIKLG